MAALQLFRRTNSKGCWNIASWHSMHSITWLWVLSYSRGHSWRPRLWWVRNNYGLQWSFTIPFVGSINWSKQRSMWWRDAYMRRELERRAAD